MGKYQEQFFKRPLIALTFFFEQRESSYGFLPLKWIKRINQMIPMPTLKNSAEKKNGEEEKEKQVSDKPNYRIISEQVI